MVGVSVSHDSNHVLLIISDDSVAQLKDQGTMPVMNNKLQYSPAGGHTQQFDCACGAALASVLYLLMLSSDSDKAA